MSLMQLAGVAGFAVTGAATNDFIWNRGCTSNTRTGAGAYTAILDTPIDTLRTLVLDTVIGGAGNANIQVTLTDATHLAITTFVGAVATNESFMILLLPVDN